MALMTLEEASAFCRYESAEAFRRAAHKLKLPIIRIGKNLLFEETDLLNHLKKHHTIHAEKVATKEESKECHSRNVVNIGTSASLHQTESEYGNLLKLATNKKRKNS